MAEKKTKEQNEPRFEVKKRQPKAKEKPNFFQNVRPLNHPLAEILNFNTEHQSLQNLDTQNSHQKTPKSTESGHPDFVGTDTQNNSKAGTQKATSFDTQSHTLLDTQKQKIKTLKQSETIHPETDNSGTETPQSLNQAPRKEKSLGAQTPKPSGVVHSKNEAWRKYEKTRSSVRVNLHIDKAIDKRVRQYCMIDADPKVELREFYERAAMHFLDFLGTQKIESLGAETPLDDRRLKMMFKSKPFIINLYLRYNSIFNELAEGTGKKWVARWSPRDDEEARRYNEISPSLVELGILQTQIQKGIGSSRIQTFKYYTDEIEKILKSGVSDEMLKTILDYHRMIWKNQTDREIDLNFLAEASD